MIEAVVSRNNKENDNQTNINLPKNLRQIGDISRDKKIYIEDYTQSYIRQTVRNRTIPCMGVLLGSRIRDGNRKYMFVNGAVKADKGIMRNNRVIMTDTMRLEIKEEAARYYHNTSEVGWYYVSDQENIEENMSVLKNHIDNYQKKDGIFIHYNYEKDELTVYTCALGVLTPLPGYYIYFEKNKNMQDYMIDNLIPATTESIYTDNTSKKIREKIREKQEEKEHEKIMSAMYVIATMVLVLAAAFGMNIIKDSRRINSVDSAISSMANTISEIGSIIMPREQPTDNSEEKAVEVMKLNGEVETETEESISESDTPTDDISSSKDTSQNNSNSNTVQSALSQSGTTNTEKLTWNSDKTTHIVEYGETITSICKKYYGNDDKKTVLMDINNLKDEDKIYVGQTLIIP